MNRFYLEHSFLLYYLLFSLLFIECTSEKGLEVVDIPDSFIFTPKTEEEPYTLIYSEEIILTGFSSRLGIKVTGNSTAKLSLNGGAYAFGGIVKEGDKLRLRVRTPDKFSSKTTVNVSIGTLLTLWEISTKRFLSGEQLNLKGASGFSRFLSKSVFMPNDPREMSSDQKKWFSKNATFNINWSLIVEHSSLANEQLDNAKMFIEGIIKTFNYIVYTKPFAKALYDMFADRDFVSVSKSPKDNPSALGTLLVLRAINTQSFLDKQIIFVLQNINSNTYTAIRSQVPLSANTDYFTEEDLIFGKKDFFKFYEQQYPKRNKMKIFIPSGNPLNILSFKGLWDYGCQGGRVPFDDFYSGFSFNVVVHEFLHAFLGWGHPKEPASINGIDLVYHTAAAVSIFLNGQTNNQKITIDIPKSEEISERNHTLNRLFGGHLPMASLGCFSSPLEFASYNVLSMYYYHYTAKSVYNPFSIGVLYRNFSPRQQEPKSIPRNPFEGIQWRLNYTGIQYE